MIFLQPLVSVRRRCTGRLVFLQPHTRLRAERAPRCRAERLASSCALCDEGVVKSLNCSGGGLVPLNICFLLFGYLSKEKSSVVGVGTPVSVSKTRLHSSVNSLGFVLA